MLPLHTARLRLEPATLDDVDRLHALWCDPQMRRYLWDDVVISREQAVEVVQALMTAAEERGIGLWLAQPAEDGALVGFCALRAIEGTGEVEILYGLAPHACGQGLATEAARAVLDYGFNVARLERIFARTDVPNRSSQRVIERLGMQLAPNPGGEGDELLSYVIERGS